MDAVDHVEERDRDMNRDSGADDVACLASDVGGEEVHLGGKGVGGTGSVHMEEEIVTSHRDLVLHEARDGGDPCVKGGDGIGSRREELSDLGAAQVHTIISVFRIGYGPEFSFEDIEVTLFQCKTHNDRMTSMNGALARPSGDRRQRRVKSRFNGTYTEHKAQEEGKTHHHLLIAD